jgi:hypothetical protein
MKIQRNIQFLEPFIQSASKLVNLNKINKVNGYVVAANKFSHQKASITRHGNKFNINLNLSDDSGQNEYLAVFLDSLAHEMAHMMPKTWEHGPDHLELQAAILGRFAKVLRKQGIKNTYRRIKYGRKEDV